MEGVDYRILTTPYDFLRFDQVCALGGMEYLMDLDRYMTTIRAITPCEIITFPRSMLHSWFSVSAEALKREAKLMGSYLMEDCRKGRLFLFLDGADRLALLFVEQFKRYSTDGLFLVRRSRQELADETGLCLKSISRAAKKLTAEGLVTKTGNQLSINREQFERMEALLSEKIDLT